MRKMSSTKTNEQNQNTMDLDLIKRLSSAIGVSGHEDEVRNLILKEVKQTCDDVLVDEIGNVIALKKSNSEQAKTIMLMANMDEVGFIINDVKEGGGVFLDFTIVGKIRPHTIISEAVAVGENKINGIISLKAVHLSTKEEREKPVLVKDLFIDIGAKEKNDIKTDVMFGDYAVFKSKFTELGENCLSNKAIASRSCCALLIDILKSRYDCNVLCVFTAQKESGIRGSQVNFEEILSNRLNMPRKINAAIVLDAIESDNAKLGGGVVFPKMINETIADKEVMESLKNVKCNDKKVIAHKVADSDIKSLSITGDGVLSAEIDIPALNLNTSTTVIDKRDLGSAKEVLIGYLHDVSL